MKENKQTICVMTSQHKPNDVRIFQKEIYSLMKYFKNIEFITKDVPDFNPPNGLNWHPIADKPGLWNRFVRNIHILKKAINVDADIYHFHDPDLIYTGFILKVLFRKKIVYDIHEYFVKMIKHRLYLSKLLRNILSIFYMISEKIILPFFDLLILAELKYMPFYNNYKNVIVVQNYLMSSNILSSFPDYSHKNKIDLVSLGAISVERGIWETIDLFYLLNKHKHCNLHMIGTCESKMLEQRMIDKIQEYGLIEQFKFYGFVENKKAIKLIRNFDIGITLLHPIENYTTSLPTKLFEYMGNGLLAITSDLLHLVEMNNMDKFGMTIDILNLENEIGKIVELLNNTQEVKKIRTNNINTVKNKYIWETQETILIEAYQNLMLIN